MKLNKYITTTLMATVVSVASNVALAGENSMGAPLIKNGLILHPVYLQPVHMAPKLPGMDAANSDAHLEIDIHADKNNPQGFEPGAWLPYLTVSYLIQKVGSDWSTFGTLLAMEADDGPHYGANIKFDGPGKYRASFKVAPPTYNAFLHHTDKETGVPGFWKPFTHTWEFTYVGGVGHKGGY